MWKNKDGTQVHGNVWVKRLGLFIVIVACFGDWFRLHMWVFWVILISIIGLIIISMITKTIWGFIKSLF